MNRDINKILNSYLVCALWSSLDDNDENFDSNYSATDFTENFINKSVADINHFLKLVDDANLSESLKQWDDEQIGHDLWLTSNGHGAGFWDRNFKDDDKILSLVGFGTDLRDIYLYLNADNKIDGE